MHLRRDRAGMGARDAIHRPERRRDSAQYSQTDSDSQTHAPRCSDTAPGRSARDGQSPRVGPGRLNGISSTSDVQSSQTEGEPAAQ